MNARRLAKPFLGLAALATVVALGYSVFQRAWPALRSHVGGSTRADLEQAVSRQRIAGARLSGTISPPDPETGAAGALAVVADLSVDVLDPTSSALVFLLNPGLTVSVATLNGEPAHHARHGNAIALRSTTPLAASAPVAVHIEYSGSLAGDSLLPASILADRVVLPHLSFWHPLDLTSFFPIECAMEIPNGWVPALNGVSESTNGSSTTVAWTEARPVLGATFIAGTYQRATRTHGAIRCDIFWEGETGPGPILDELSAAYSYLRVLYGSDGFDHICAVVDPRFPASFNGGNSVIGLPRSLSSVPRERLALLARNAAYNWWGNTVTGHWFAQKPEAASWLVHGFAEYSAWLALRGVKGRTEQLRYVESLRCPPTIGFPMKAISLRDAYEPPLAMSPSDPSFIYVRQPFAVSVFAAQTGDERFLEACKSILRLHRYRPVSYLAVLQEFERASETNLRETFRVWFERTGTFDYAIDGARQDADSVRVSISNPGDIPAFGELHIALVTSAGTALHAIEPGARGGSFQIPADMPVTSVVLDPEFRYPDMRRENNTWPR